MPPSNWKALCLAFVVALIAVTQASASVIVGGFTILDTFNFVDARQSNSLGIAPGVRDSFGLDLSPVGTQPVTALDGTTVTAARGGPAISVPYLYSPALPNQFFVSDRGALQTTPWTLSLSNPAVNGGAVATIQTAALATTTPPPFVNSVSVTTNGLTPTISWSVPSGSTATAQTLFIFDRTIVTPDGPPLIYTSLNLPASQASFTVPQNVLTDNHTYYFSVQEDVRSAGQLIARARSYTGEYRQTVQYPPGTVIQLPVIKISGDTPVYSFDFPVLPGSVYYLDPALADGYLYQTGAGDPLFSSISLPSFGPGVSYTVCLPAGASFVCNIGLLPDDTYAFGGGGVSAFEILVNGAAFDVGDGLPFISDLTFAGAGTFTGSITPLISAIPAPPSIAILAAGLFMLLRWRLLAPAAALVLAACATGDPQTAHQYSAAHPVHFACPASGTTTDRRSDSGTIHEVWQGADPADPIVCVRTGSDGQAARFLYTLPNHFLPTPADEGKIRIAWAKAFDGSSEDNCYDYTGVSAAPPRGMPSNTYTWLRCVRQLGETTIALDGVPTRLVAFRMTDRGTADSNYAADFTYFYDPARNLFTHCEVSRIRRFGPGAWSRTVVLSSPS